VPREKLVEDLRRDLKHAQQDGVDTEKIYRAALEIDRLGRWPRLPSPYVPHPLPPYEQVRP
jgi:hypothetical protein